LDTSSSRTPAYATAKARNVAAIPDVLREFGADVPAILQRAGVDPNFFGDLEQVMPYASLGRLMTESVKATGCESFGLRVGAKTRLSSLGLTSLVSLNAPTVRDALRVINDTLKTSETGGTALLDDCDGLASFGYAVVAPNIESVDQIEDASVAIAFNIMRRLCGPAWRPIRVRLGRYPPRDRTPFARFFEAPVEFGTPSTVLVFDSATLDKPVRDRDPDAAEILAPLLREAAAVSHGDFLSSVRSVIRSQIGARALSRDSVCRALGLNARTFAHRLEAFGVTYSGLADEAKCEAAQSLLMKERRIADIAALLGFAEQSAFTRAFKAWSGTTPARWRAERKGEGRKRQRAG
jgi:AraC-like DNA-binding protein